jgi:transcriptional regulator with XRE-family HTH domain
MSESQNNDNRLTELGRLLHSRRIASGMSFRELGKVTGIERSNLHRLETGQIKKPRPAHLNALADVFDIPVADLYGYAGLPMVTALPSFAPYLRSKYTDLPPDAQHELEAAFAKVTAKYGIHPDGPTPGEDE